MKQLLYLSLAMCLFLTNIKAQIGNTNLNKLKTDIDLLFKAEIDEGEPGAAILVSYDSKMIIGKGYGVQNLEDNTPISTSTNFRMASLSKQFTALTILSLVDENRISLNDSLFSFFPCETFKGVTIQHLLNHTSGIIDAENIFFKEWKSEKNVTNKDFLDWYEKENRKLSKPGEKYQYNNGAYAILPLIVEKVSGQKFESYIKENIFTKLGMRNTDFLNPELPIEIKEMAHCHEKDSFGNWSRVKQHFLNGVLGAGGVYTNVEDYFKYVIALDSRTIFFNSSTHDLIFKPTVQVTPIDSDNFYYAMGWFVNENIAGHLGSWFGTNTSVRRDFEKPLTIAIFMNRNTLFQGELIKKTEDLIYQYVADNF